MVTEEEFMNTGEKMVQQWYKDESGMSLMELVVSVAILAIVGGAILSFFSFSILQSRSIDEDGTLHMESQNAWNQMRNELQNANYGLYSDGSQLVIYTADGVGDAANVITKTVYSMSDGHIMYNCYTRNKGDSKWTQSELDKDQVFAGFVEDLSFKVTDADGKNLVTSGVADDIPHSVTVHILMKNGKKETNVERNVMIRNAMKWIPQ